jgi:hypothetical protein
MKKFILSLVIMSLGVITLIGTVGAYMLGSFQNPSVMVGVLWFALMVLGITATIYGAITSFKEAKK